MSSQGPGATNTYFEEHFSSLKEPRRTSKGNFVYPLEEILFLTISAVICGCNTWVSIADFGKLKLEWLQEFYPYKNKTPSHDAISDLFAILDSDKFGECFSNWICSIAKLTESDVVAFDGKTIRGVASNSRKFPIHIVTAFCVRNRISLGQKSVDDKSNEIIAIPQLLENLALKGCTVTIDAMGCQKKIAEKIIEKGADYILQVKDNQKRLKEQLKEAFEGKLKRKIDSNVDCGHGRIEIRKCEVISNLDFLKVKKEWEDLSSIVRIKSIRELKGKDIISKEYRYYITSLKGSAKQINRSIRSHWSIENNLHWNLDVIFKEDGQLKRKGNSAKNFNIINKAALSLIDSEKSLKKTKPLKMLRAALSDKYREKILKV